MEGAELRAEESSMLLSLSMPAIGSGSMAVGHVNGDLALRVEMEPGIEPA